MYRPQLHTGHNYIQAITIQGMPIQTLPMHTSHDYAGNLELEAFLDAHNYIIMAHNYIGHNYTGNLELEAFLDAEVPQEWQRDGPQCVHAQRLCADMCTDMVQTLVQTCA